ncbi:hypothetical protein HEK616_02840 [Streptomyces nigrescens]|uniref:Uncharacterized protein n=1 Tax=Streptomyces nigrescens TaxID=1920 RepID=A0ABM7ZKJ4_STRNI|nr:hypothetical protein HEK616_02840 [Streptomyces nigrescens]
MESPVASATSRRVVRLLGLAMSGSLPKAGGTAGPHRPDEVGAGSGGDGTAPVVGPGALRGAGLDTLSG